MGPCRRRPHAWVAVLLLLVLLLAPRAASAAGEDSAVQQTVKQVLDDDYARGSFATAQSKLTAALDRCKACSGPAKAQVYVILGMIASQSGKAEDAKNDFATALGADPNAKLPERGITPMMKTQWADALQLVSSTPPASEKPTDAAQEASPPPPATTPPPPSNPSGPRKIPGWEYVEAFQKASAGLAADLAGKLEECIKDDTDSLAIEEQPRTRLHLASCERRVGKLIDALRDAQRALESGIQKKDVAVMKAARIRVQDLLQRIAHVTFELPPGSADVRITFDEREVPADSFAKKFSVDPGKHKVHAEGAATKGGSPLSFDKEYDVKEGELVTVRVEFQAQPPTSDYLTASQLRCMLGAKTPDEVVRCLPRQGKNLVVKAGLDVAGYGDTTNVYVFTPSVNGSIVSPTGGWNVGGSFVVDIISAASPDIVSSASLAYREQRYAGVLTGGYKPGRFGFQLTGSFSDEPDYISGGGSLAVMGDFNDRLTTPRLAFGHYHDEIGRGPNNFISTLETSEVEAGVTQVLNGKTIVVLGATGQFERGDQSKPYRYVPMFSASAAAQAQPGESIAWVNEFRIAKPLEQLPTSRDRYALGIRLNHRLAMATIRLDERVYWDTWNLAATTTDARILFDVGKSLRLWPHARLNAQTGTNFYQLAYTLNTNSTTTQVPSLPLYRTDDRELSPLITLTGGGGARIALGAVEAKTQWGLNLSGDVMYTKYFDALYITYRTAVYGAVGLDAEFE